MHPDNPSPDLLAVRARRTLIGWIAFVAIIAVGATAAVVVAVTQLGDRHQTSGPLQPAEQALASEQATAGQNATVVDFGAAGQLGEGVMVVVSDPQVLADEQTPYLRVHVRVENRGGAATVPNVGIMCTGATDPGGDFASSTLRSGDELPAGSFREGVFDLLRPGDDAVPGQSVPVCAAPASIQVTPTVWTTAEPPMIRVPLPPSLLEQLNR